jgi:hypothetical protein
MIVQPISSAKNGEELSITDALKISSSGVTYFNPLHVHYKTNMILKHASVSDLDSRGLSKCRRQSIKLITENNNDARCVCTMTMKSPRKMKIFFWIMLFLYIIYNIFSTRYIERNPLLYVFLLHQFVFITQLTSNRYQKINGLKQNSMIKSFLPFIAFFLIVFVVVHLYLSTY